VLARWGTVAAYAAAAGANQLLWLTYAPITTDAAEHFGVSEGTIGWLSQVFPLFYVVLALPAGLALDRAFRSTLATAAWLTAVGGAVRLTSDTFEAALAGQILIAIAQPFILNAVTKLATAALPAPERPKGIALGSAGIFAGTALALPLAPAVPLQTLLWIDLAVATAAALALTVALRGIVTRREGTAELRTAWPRIKRLCGVAFLGFGVFVALTTWLQTLLEPAGIEDTTAGWLLAAMVLAGVVTSALAPAPLARHGAERPFLRAAAVTAAAACLLLAVAPGAALIAVIPLGVALLGALPVLLELTERRTDAASGAALIWLAGNTGGIVVAVAVQAVNGHPTVAFALLAATAAGVLAFA
jgi:predicted MFS family arabinose efflux permease